MLHNALNSLGFQQYSNIECPEKVSSLIIPTKAEFDILTTNTGVSVVAKNNVKTKLFMQPVNPGLYIKFNIDNIDIYKRLIILNNKDNSFETDLINNIAEYNKKHSLIDQNTLLNYCTDLKVISLTHIGELYVHGISDLSKYAHHKFDIITKKPVYNFSVIIIDNKKKSIVIESKHLFVSNSINNALNSSSVDLLDIDLFGTDLNNVSLRNTVLTALLSNQDNVLQKMHHRLNYWFGSDDTVMKSVIKNTDKVTASIVMLSDPEIISMVPGVVLNEDISSSTESSVQTLLDKLYSKPVKRSIKNYVAPENRSYLSSTDIYNANITLIKNHISSFIGHIGNNSVRDYKYAHFVLRYHIVKYCGLNDINYVTNLLCKLGHSTHIDYIAEYIHKMILREYNIVLGELTEEQLLSSEFLKTYMLLVASIMSIRDQS